MKLFDYITFTSLYVTWGGERLENDCYGHLFPRGLQFKFICIHFLSPLMLLYILQNFTWVCTASAVQVSQQSAGGQQHIFFPSYSTLGIFCSAAQPLWLILHQLLKFKASHFSLSPPLYQHRIIFYFCFFSTSQGFQIDILRNYGGHQPTTVEQMEQFGVCCSIRRTWVSIPECLKWLSILQHHSKCASSCLRVNADFNYVLSSDNPVTRPGIRYSSPWCGT